MIQIRSSLLQGTTALLYLGPMLAGLSGHPLALMPLYALFFVLWTIVVQPETWRRTSRTGRSADFWLSVTAQIAVQILLALVCLGAGRGIAGVAGITLDIPITFPLTVAFLAIPLSRLLVPMTSRVSDVPIGPGLPTLDELELADALLEPLAMLAPYTPTEVLERHLNAMAPNVSAKALIHGLMISAASAKAPAVIQRAFVQHATDPTAALAADHPNAIAGAFQVARKDVDLLTVFANRALHLIRLQPNLYTSYPTHSDVREAAALAVNPHLRETLSGLAEVLQLSGPGKHST